MKRTKSMGDLRKGMRREASDILDDIRRMDPADPDYQTKLTQYLKFYETLSKHGTVIDWNKVLTSLIVTCITTGGGVALIALVVIIQNSELFIRQNFIINAILKFVKIGGIVV